MVIGKSGGLWRREVAVSEMPVGVCFLAFGSAPSPGRESLVGELLAPPSKARSERGVGPLYARVNREAGRD